MSRRLPRLVAPLSIAAAFAVAAPAAHAATTASFPDAGTTVTITDPGPASDTVHLRVASDGTHDLADIKVFLGPNAWIPDTAIDVDGVRDARYDPDFDGELSTLECAVYSSADTYDVPVTSIDADTFESDLPKGEVIGSDQTAVGVGVAGVDDCAESGFPGVAIDWLADNQTIDGFSWAAPDAPDVTAATGGRRQVTLSFDQERGTFYDVYPVIGGVRSDTPILANVRGNGDDVQVVLDEDADGNALEPGTTHAFQVQATRIFYNDGEEDQPVSPFSAVATATTAAAQTVRFGTVPASHTTSRSAQFSWTIDANAAGDAPFCLLDPTEVSGTEVPCTTTGATLDGLTVGAHSLHVYPSDGEGAFEYSWTVDAEPVVAAPVAAPAPAPAPVQAIVPAAPKTVGGTDTDGDGIQNTWLVNGKPAAAPATPTVTVTGGTKVKLKLAAAPAGAKKVRVFRADGKSVFKVVTTLTPKAKTFTDAKVKPGHTYTYKTVAVNAKGQQGAASKAATAKVAKKK